MSWISLNGQKQPKSIENGKSVIRKFPKFARITKYSQISKDTREQLGPQKIQIIEMFKMELKQPKIRKKVQNS